LTNRSIGAVDLNNGGSPLQRGIVHAVILLEYVLWM